MVQTLQATQAREGIETTREQAERAYYVVTESEASAFFALRSFGSRVADQRERAFVRALTRGEVDGITVRYNVPHRDFAALEGHPLTYAQIAILAPLVRASPPLDPTWAAVRGGLNSTESARFVRYRWEPGSTSIRRWVRYSKGGNYARFYSDLNLVFDWTADGADFRSIVKRRYGSESRFVKSREFYFRRGLTWTEKSSLGFSVRILEEGAIFNVAGPTAFPRRHQDEWYLLGVLNSCLIGYVAWALSGRSYGASYISALPIPRPTEGAVRIGTLAREVFERKSLWDEGNETSSRFRGPWLVGGNLRESRWGLTARLRHVLKYEDEQNIHIQERYAEMNEEVYNLYGIPDSTRAIIEDAVVGRPPESLWQQMASKTIEQRRMEHVFRVLSYIVKRVVEEDGDGIVPFERIAGKPGLVERVHRELQVLFSKLDVNGLEAEIANELQARVSGYRRTNGIAEWLEEVFFEYHCALYKGRPIFWHIASRQGTGRFAFGALVHYHRFDRNRIAQLRAQYLRDAVEIFRREAALADREGRVESHQEWRARLEEVQGLDVRLQRIQEGYHEGPDGGKEDYRILTPWKAPEDRPKGWDPDVDDGVRVNIEPLQRGGVLRVAKVV